MSNGLELFYDMVDYRGSPTSASSAFPPATIVPYAVGAAAGAATAHAFARRISAGRARLESVVPLTVAIAELVLFAVPGWYDVIAKRSNGKQGLDDAVISFGPMAYRIEELGATHAWASNCRLIERSCAVAALLAVSAALGYLAAALGVASGAMIASERLAAARPKVVSRLALASAALYLVGTVLAIAGVDIGKPNGVKGVDRRVGAGMVLASLFGGLAGGWAVARAYVRAGDGEVGVGVEVAAKGSRTAPV